MILHRTTPPALDGGWLTIGKGQSGAVRVADGPPRIVEGATPEDVLSALERASAAIWGHQWRAPMEEACGLAKNATKEWKRRDQVPPLAILGWIAWVVARPDRKAVGAHMLGLVRGKGEAVEAARLAVDGLTPAPSSRRESAAPPAAKG